MSRNPSQADDIAKKYNLKFYKLDNVTTSTALPDVNTQPELTNAIFAAPKGAVTDVTQVANQGKAAFAVVTNVVAAHNADFAAVQNDVTQRYTTAESERLGVQ